jgi:hypothetical protein
MSSGVNAKRLSPAIRQSWKANITICWQTRSGKIRKKRLLASLSRETASPRISFTLSMEKEFLSKN